MCARGVGGQLCTTLLMVLGCQDCCCYGDERQGSCLSFGDTCHGEAAWVSCSERSSGFSVRPLMPFLAFHHGGVGMAASLLPLLLIHPHIHCCVVMSCFSSHSPFLFLLRPLCTPRKQHQCNSFFWSRPFGFNSSGE